MGLGSACAHLLRGLPCGRRGHMPGFREGFNLESAASISLLQLFMSPLMATLKSNYTVPR